MTKVKVLEVDATALDPNAQYILVFDRRSISRDDARQVKKILDDKSIDTVVLLTEGNPHETTAVYQIPKENKDA